MKIEIVEDENPRVRVKLQGVGDGENGIVDLDIDQMIASVEEREPECLADEFANAGIAYPSADHPFWTELRNACRGALRELAFCLLLVGALVSQSLPALADGQPTAAEFQAMDCTQAIDWASAEIQKTWSNFGVSLPDDQAATLAVQVLSQLPDSPCAKRGIE